MDLLQFGCKSNYFGERKKLIFLFYKTKIVRKLRPIKRCCEFLRFFFSNRIANKRLKEKRNKKGFFSLKLERLKFFSELCSIFKYLRLKNFKVSMKVIWWHLSIKKWHFLHFSERDVFQSQILFYLHQWASFKQYLF